MIKKTTTFLALACLSAVWAQNDKPKFTSTPSLSPNGETAYFSYQGDLWQASTKGGKALRITALEGIENNPRVSPDGQWIAFTSNQLGNKDVYIMPVNGGEIKQLTFHQAAEDVESWSWDSQTIYFTSSAENNFASYKVSINGGTPTPLFSNYFNTTNGLIETPDGEYIFTNSTESANQVTRKRYKGENNPELLGYNPTTGVFKNHTNYEGKDFNASVDRNGIIYFISDEINGHYNLYSLNNGVKKALTAFETSIKKPFVSADGSKVIFEKDYQLYLYDTKTEKYAPLTITVNSATTLFKEQAYKTQDNISFFDVSPDNKKIAFISRGVLFVSDIDGKFIQQISDGDQRAMEVKWLNDNKTLLYNQTYNGYQNWFKVSADGKGKVEQLTFDNRNNRDLTLNTQGTQGVYLSGRDEIRLIDLASFKSTAVVKDEIWAFQNSKPSFSPNGEYVLFTAKRNFEEDIFVHHIKQGKTINLTNTGVSESNPVWSPDGKYIYFTSDRFNPSYPLGTQNPSIYRFALDWVTNAFRSDQFDKLFVATEKEETTDNKKKKKESKENKTITSKTESITINTDGILDRIELVSDRFGNQSTPSVFQNDKKQIVFYTSNQENGKYVLYKKTYEDFEKEKTEKAADLSLYLLNQRDKTVYGLSGGNIYKFSLPSGKPEKIAIAHTFNKNLGKEFNQMFYETWAGVEENFYDETFHGIDWVKTKEHFAQYLPYLQDRDDLRVLLNDMVGELGSSHLGFSSSGKEEATKLNFSTQETGIVFDKDNPYKVSRIVRKSPAHALGNTIQKGDILKKINNESLDPSKNRDSYFTFPTSQEEIALTFERNGKEINTKLHPISNGVFKGLLYDEWIQTNKNRVNEWGNNRIAYSYMKNMSSGQLETFLLDMVEQEHRKEGVILDLRFNTGGNVHDKVLNFLLQRPYLQWKYREGALTVQSNFSPSGKPIVLLINEYSLSDAEMTAAGFKALKLGKIIGQETYRWIIFTSGKSLVDGSSYRLPSWGTYTLEGDNLEKTGVAPDIYVKNTFLDRLNDRDPQLERAVEEILKELK